VLSTYLSDEAARRLRHGVPWVYRDEIVRMDGTPSAGETVLLKDSEGRPLGFGDVDLESAFAIRRLGMPNEAPSGLIQRHLRRALQRRGLVEDPRYCRLVNDDGDGLPGLVVDRFEGHFVVQTFTRAMDARVEEIARSLVEVLGARSVLLRNDSQRRAALKLPLTRPHVLYGTPPRWTRVLELGARFTIDLHAGLNTGFFYDHREVRKAIVQMSSGARVLDACCNVGGLFVHAGLHGAKSILAFEADADAADLARENAEANGLIARAVVETVDAFDALERLHEPFDLVIVDAPALPAAKEGSEEPFIRLLRLGVRNTRHGGRMIVSGYHPPLPVGALDERVALACELEGRLATRLMRPSLPPDFPTIVGSPGAEYLSAIAVGLS
jgi:23S rRNA (cytosine1962-C5)-methyltransferase